MYDTYLLTYTTAKRHDVNVIYLSS